MQPRKSRVDSTASVDSVLGSFRLRLRLRLRLSDERHRVRLDERHGGADALHRLFPRRRAHRERVASIRGWSIILRSFVTVAFAVAVFIIRRADGDDDASRVRNGGANGGGEFSPERRRGVVGGFVAFRRRGVRRISSGNRIGPRRVWTRRSSPPPTPPRLPLPAPSRCTARPRPPRGDAPPRPRRARPDRARARHANSNKRRRLLRRSVGARFTRSASASPFRVIVLGDERVRRRGRRLVERRGDRGVYVRERERVFLPGEIAARRRVEPIRKRVQEILRREERVAIRGVIDELEIVIENVAGAGRRRVFRRGRTPTSFLGAARRRTPWTVSFVWGWRRRGSPRRTRRSILCSPARVSSPT